jgi:predicted  nucleic acid-binding Zn-ribbon protein
MTTRGKSRLARRFDDLVEVQRERLPMIDTLENATRDIRHTVSDVEQNISQLEETVRGLAQRIDRLEERTIGRRLARWWGRTIRMVSTGRNRALDGEP